MGDKTYVYLVSWYDAEHFGTQRVQGYYDIAQAAEFCAQVNGTISVLIVQ